MDHQGPAQSSPCSAARAAGLRTGARLGTAIPPGEMNEGPNARSTFSSMATDMRRRDEQAPP